MNIYFSANHRNIERNITLYRQILNAIRSEGHVLVNNWVETANSIWPVRQNYDWTKVCIESRTGVDDADMIVVEASGQTGLGVGYEVAYATSKGKKVVILIKKSEIENSYASGLDKGEVKIYEYDAKNIEKIVCQAMRAAK